MGKLSDTTYRKFIEQLDVDGIEILTDTGFHPVTASNKTVEYDVWELRLENGDILECADTHIVFDHEFNEVYVRDLSVGDLIMGRDGAADLIGEEKCEEEGHCSRSDSSFNREDYRASVVRVSSVIKTPRKENMYDLTVNSPDNRYYTNGVLSHNTTTLGLIALHFATFNPDYAVGITSFTVGNVKDFVNRIKYSYEHLPNWLKAPVKTYNTSTIEFTNDSIIYGQVTSPNALRGRTNNLVIIDEYAFCPPAVADEFYTAILPSLTADGEASTTKAVFISTPNGTTGKFAEIAFGAMANENGFKFHMVNHKLIAGRTEKFRQDMIRKLGLNKYEQEYENKWLSSKSTLVDSRVIEAIVTKEPIREDKGLKIFVDSFIGRTISISVDPSEGVGGDNHCVQIFDVHSLEQLAVYTNNTDNQHMLTKKIIDIITLLYNNGAVEIYYGVENNGVGNGVLRLLESANNSYLDRATMISTTDKDGIIRKSGISMTASSKRIGCAQLKQMIENLQLKINDPATKVELQFFVKSGNSFKAERGAKDDRVMALVVTMLIFLELVVYEDSVDEAVNDIGEADDEAWGFSF